MVDSGFFLSILLTFKANAFLKLLALSMFGATWKFEKSLENSCAPKFKYYTHTIGHKYIKDSSKKAAIKVSNKELSVGVERERESRKKNRKNEYCLLAIMSLENNVIDIKVYKVSTLERWRESSCSHYSINFFSEYDVPREFSDVCRIWPRYIKKIIRTHCRSIYLKLKSVTVK